MTRRVTLLHRTVYHYDRPVQLGPQLVRLRPLADPRAAMPGFHLTVDPDPGSRHWLLDPFGNPVLRIALAHPVARLAIEVRLELDLTPRNPFDFVLDPDAVRWPFAYAEAEGAALAAFMGAEGPGPLLRMMQEQTAVPQDTVGFVLALGALVCSRVAYIVRMEAGVWPPERTLSEARGSCRDSAWLLVQLLRLHGIAARFVSGYLVQLGPEDAEPPGEAELHAWAEAYLPGAGWIGIDATSGLLAAEGHIALAAAPDPAGAAPLQGTVEPGEVRLETGVTLARPA